LVSFVVWESARCRPEDGTECEPLSVSSLLADEDNVFVGGFFVCARADADERFDPDDLNC